MILIAGGKGFIGSHVAKVFDGLDAGLYEIADLKDGVDVCTVDGSKYDIIILLAANLGHDMQMFQDNLAIYRWACKQKNAHIIYTSSAAVYADSVQPHSEGEPTPAPTIYGRSKLLGDGDGNGVIDIFKRGGSSIYGMGNDIRDYVHVKVVAEAIKTIALNPAQYNKEIFNISSGYGRTTNQIWDEYGDGIASYVPSRGFDMECSILNNRKAVNAGLIDAN
jgi:nucleoside-diphosphate-sugar epimerase